MVYTSAASATLAIAATIPLQLQYPFIFTSYRKTFYMQTVQYNKLYNLYVQSFVIYCTDKKLYSVETNY
jgi:hypothetical protein